MFRSLPFLTMLILAAACGNAPETEYEDAGSTLMMLDEVAEESMIRSPGTLPPAPPAEEIQVEKKIIRNGNMTLRSRDLAASKTRMDSLAICQGGYITSENYNDHANQHGYNITYRIPANRFDAFLEKIESGQEKIESKSINANDVTEQYYDVKIRLENERRVEQRYLELLDRANTIKEILEVEEKLGEIRQEIEAKEGRLRYLDNQVGYSTLNVYVYERKDRAYEPADRDPFGQRFLKALHSGWLGLVDVLLFFLNLWPLWLVALLIWRFVVWLTKRSKKR